jgi:peptide/nickel transport system substrate-binding protein
LDRRTLLRTTIGAALGVTGTGLLDVPLLGRRAWAQKRGGTMVIGAGGEAPNVVGFLDSDSQTFMIAANVFSGLIGFNRDFEPVPELAASWTISGDGRTYTFNLVKNARFHDGTPVTAEDCAFTFNEVIAKCHPSRGTWWPNVDSATARDPSTFVLQLKKPFPAMMSLLAYELRSGALIVPKHLYQGSDPAHNPANQHPVGSGPFRFVEWVRGSHVEMARNNDYFVAGKPYLDRLIVQFIPDPATRVLAFERGEIDFIDYTSVPHNEVRRFEKDKRFQVIRVNDAIAVQGMWLLNVRHPILKDVKVRQALYYALDTDDIADKALFGAGKPARSVLNSNLAWVYTDKYAYAHDVAKANQMLDEAGYKRGPDGTRFKLNVAWATGRAYDGKAAELVRDQLREVGVPVTVQVYDRSTFVDKVFTNWDFDTCMQLISTGPDPSISVTTRFATDQINRAPYTNAMGYSNPELDKIFLSDSSELDRTKRKQYWDDAQRILMRDLPMIPLFQFPDGHLATAKLKNAVTGPFGYFQNRQDAYFT